MIREISIDGYSASAFISCPLNEPPRAVVQIGRQEGGAVVDIKSFTTTAAPAELTCDWLVGFIGGVAAAGAKANLPSIEQAPSERQSLPISDRYSDLLLKAICSGSLQQFLSPIPAAEVTEWMAGFLAAAEFATEFPEEIRSLEVRSSERWLSIQAIPRSILFGQGVHAFRRLLQAEIQASEDKSSIDHSHSSPAVGLDNLSMTEGGL